MEYPPPQKKRKEKEKKINQKIVKPKKHIKGSFLLSPKSGRHEDSLRAAYRDVTAIVINRILLLPNTLHVSTCRSQTSIEHCWFNLFFCIYARRRANKASGILSCTIFKLLIFFFCRCSYFLFHSWCDLSSAMLSIQ